MSSIFTKKEKPEELPNSTNIALETNETKYSDALTVYYFINANIDLSSMILLLK